MRNLYTQGRAPWQRALLYGVVTIVVALALVHVFYYFCRTVDDMFISLRYAERWVGGHGLTYNEGERVEGYSSPLWLMLQAALMAVGVDGVVATKVLSLVSFVLLSWGVYRLAREVGGVGAMAAWLAVGLVAASSYVVSWAMLGLETPLYLALLVHLLVALRRASAREVLRPRDGVALVGLALAFIATRPEAPLYVSAMAVGTLVDRPSRARVRRLAPYALALALLVGALLVARHAYFGEWLPQTYFAKRGGAFDLAKLAPIVAQGAPWPEVVVHAGALLLALRWAVQRRSTLFFCMLANLVFIAKVDVDWMPNIRHALPIVVLSAALWAELVQWLATRTRVATTAAMTLLLAYAGTAFAIDSRYAIWDFKTHGKGERWVLPKGPRGWDTAWQSIRRELPAHAAELAPERPGQVAQVFDVIEAAAIPMEDGWVIARDVGMLGYYTPAQVFDTDGLFTPALTDSPAWVASGAVDDALLDVTYDRTLLTTELYEGFQSGLARRADLRDRFDIVQGSARHPVRLRSKGLARPSDAELMRRYDAVKTKFEAFFYLATLYGESVGAVVEKRWAWTMGRLITADETPVTSLPPNLGPTAIVDDGRVRVHGCAIETPHGVRALVCYFEALAKPSRDWQVFVHGVDARGERKLHLDHAPVGGRRPATSWRIGERVRDITPLVGDTAGLEIRFGLWDPQAGMAKAATTDPHVVDDHGRLRGPHLY